MIAAENDQFPYNIPLGLMLPNYLLSELTLSTVTSRRPLFSLFMLVYGQNDRVLDEILY